MTVNLSVYFYTRVLNGECCLIVLFSYSGMYTVHVMYVPTELDRVIFSIAYTLARDSHRFCFPLVMFALMTIYQYWLCLAILVLFYFSTSQCDKCMHVTLVTVDLNVDFYTRVLNGECCLLCFHHHVSSRNSLTFSRSFSLVCGIDLSLNNPICLIGRLSSLSNCVTELLVRTQACHFCLQLAVYTCMYILCTCTCRVL